MWAASLFLPAVRLTMLLALGACGRPATETQQEAPKETGTEAAAASGGAEEAGQGTPGAVGENDPVTIPGQGEEALFAQEPYIPENLEKAIIGYDDRVEVSPRSYPFACIAYVIAEAECGCRWTASGFMVSRYGFMTASHALYCYTHEKPIKYLECYFGYRSPKDYLYKFNGAFTWWRGINGPGDAHQNDNDYAYLLLSQPVGGTTGWLGLRAIDDITARNGEFYCAGYRDGVIKASMAEMTPYCDKLFHHYMDTQGGYSGGPVYDVEAYVVGINVAEDYYGTYNVARRITVDLIGQMYDSGIFD